MTAAYVYTPAIWLPLAASIFLAVLSLHSWRHRSVPGALPLAAGSLFGALWLLGMAFEVAAVAVTTKIAWLRFQAAWQLPAVSATTCFALEYACPGRWLTRRNLALLSLPPLLILLLIVFADSQFFWSQVEFGANGLVVIHPSALVAIVVAYAFSLVLVNGAAFLGLFIRSPQHRGPVALMLFGEVAARLLYSLNLGHRPSAVLFDPAIAALIVVWSTYAIALFGYRILDPLPVARRTVIEQMLTGVVVFDGRWRVVSLNPAAERILGVQNSRSRGKPWQGLLPAGGPLPALPDASIHPTGAALDLPEMTFGSGSGARLYVPSLSPLTDYRGLLIGHLLTLRDVTERHQAEAQRLEQRWAQATLEEGEQLAHELHDGLSQSLAFLNVQAQAAQLYLEAEQGEAARTSLVRLAEVARQMQGDLRELIGNLLAVSLPSEGVCATLRQSVAQFEQQNGLAVDLDIDPAATLCDPGLLPASAGVQLVRIVQEALANVRKHGGDPNQISVRLRVEAGEVQVTVTDNGAGFDPQAMGANGRHFGLQVMRQRAERIGGRLTVHSAPGQGTRVEVNVPLANKERGWQHENPAGGRSRPVC